MDNCPAPWVQRLYGLVYVLSVRPLLRITTNGTAVHIDTMKHPQIASLPEAASYALQGACTRNSGPIEAKHESAATSPARRILPRTGTHKDNS